MMRKCRTCGLDFAETNFYRSRPKIKSGEKEYIQLDCKQCCRKKSTAYQREMKLKYPEDWRSRQSEYNKRKNTKIRLELIAHYSQGTNSCACCGENNIEFLALDHIEGGGKQHREKVKAMGSVALYYHLRKLKFPSGYRILCHNCNLALGFYGYCPHERERAGEAPLQ